MNHLDDKSGEHGGDLEVGEGGQGEDNGGDDDEADGDERHNLSKGGSSEKCFVLNLDH